MYISNNNNIYIFCGLIKIKYNTMKTELKSFILIWIVLIEIINIGFWLFFFLEIFESYDTSDNILTLSILYTIIHTSNILFIYIPLELIHYYILGSIYNKYNLQNIKLIWGFRLSLIFTSLFICFMLWINYIVQNSNNKLFGNLYDIHIGIYQLCFLLSTWLFIIFFYNVHSYIIKDNSISIINKMLCNIYKNKDLYV